MNDELGPEEIRAIRKKYGLSQRAFAQVLGLGEASVARYEKGVKPTRANANLLRAARKSSFMLDCLRRDGDRIAPEQRAKAEQIIYAEVTFDEKGEAMGMNEIYSITLQQEILNEQAAEMLGELSRLRREAREAGDEALATVYDDIVRQLLAAKDSTLDARTESEIAEVRGQILCLRQLTTAKMARAA